MANPSPQGSASEQPASPPLSSNVRPRSARGPLGRALFWVLRKVYGGIQAVVTVPLTLGFLYVGWLSLVYLWNHNYSTGSRTGTIRKVSYKGTPLCKYVSIEMVLPGTRAGMMAAPEIWEFTLDDEREGTPLRMALETAERSQKTLTVRYRQDLKRLPWRWCVETQYYAVKID